MNTVTWVRIARAIRYFGHSLEIGLDKQKLVYIIVTALYAGSTNVCLVSYWPCWMRSRQSSSPVSHQCKPLRTTLSLLASRCSERARGWTHHDFSCNCRSCYPSHDSTEVSEEVWVLTLLFHTADVEVATGLVSFPCYFPLFTFHYHLAHLPFPDQKALIISLTLFAVITNLLSSFILVLFLSMSCLWSADYVLTVD